MNSILYETSSTNLINAFLHSIAILRLLANTPDLADNCRHVSWLHDPQELHQDLLDFLSYLRHVCYNLPALNNVTNSRKKPLVTLLDAMQQLNLNSPTLISNYQGSEKQRLLKSVLFHTTLELRWTLLVGVTMLQKHFERSPEAFLLTDQTPTFAKVPPHSKLDMVMKKAEQNGFLSLAKSELASKATADLVQMSMNKLKTSDNELYAVNNVSPFNCVCVRELWFLIFKTCSDADSFWTMLSAVLDLNSGDDKPGANIILSDHPTLKFRWWIIESLAPFETLDVRGESMNNSNMRWQEEIINNVRMSLEDTHVDETNLKTTLAKLSSVTRIYGANLAILSELWEFFSKKLNENLREKGNTVWEGMTFVPEKPSEWAAKLGLLSGVGSDVGKNKLGSDSFENFLDFAEASFSQCETEMAQKKICGKFLGKCPATHSEEIADEYSTNTRRNLDEEFFFAGEEFWTLLLINFNLLLRKQVRKSKKLLKN